MLIHGHDSLLKARCSIATETKNNLVRMGVLSRSVWRRGAGLAGHIRGIKLKLFISYKCLFNPNFNQLFQQHHEKIRLEDQDIFRILKSLWRRFLLQGSLCTAFSSSG